MFCCAGAQVCYCKRDSFFGSIPTREIFNIFIFLLWCGGKTVTELEISSFLKSFKTNYASFISKFYYFGGRGPGAGYDCNATVVSSISTRENEKNI